MSGLTQKLKEAALSVSPIVVIVLILSFTAAPMDWTHLIRFVVGALLITLGLSLFLFGVEIGIDRIGHFIGSAIIKTNRILIVLAFGLLLGFFISIAEPDLHILAGQIDAVTAGLIPKLKIVVVVSVGIAVMLAAGFTRILYNVPLKIVLSGCYLIILILSFFTPSEFLPIAFDASGATTGALTVPFILALALGVSSLKKDSTIAEKDSFGLVAIVSTGAIISVMIMNISLKTEELTGGLHSNLTDSPAVLMPFLQKLPNIALEILIALAPILLIFLFLQIKTKKLEKKQTRRILLGLFYAFFGLTLLLTGVNAGFFEVGILVGFKVASLGNMPLLVAIGFLLGLVTVLAEPAVHALTNQVVEVTSGYVKKRTILAALSAGIGIAVALSMLRIIIPQLQLWHYLLPGYILSVAMSYLVPDLFVGIAFDSGGVASGPMTATFILAFAQGAAEAIEGADVLADGFGIIAMVALTPLLTLQILGLIYKIKSRKGGIEEDERDS